MLRGPAEALAQDAGDDAGSAAEIEDAIGRRRSGARARRGRGRSARRCRERGLARRHRRCWAGRGGCKAHGVVLHGASPPRRDKSRNGVPSSGRAAENCSSYQWYGASQPGSELGILLGDALEGVLDPALHRAPSPVDRRLARGAPDPPSASRARARAAIVSISSRARSAPLGVAARLGVLDGFAQRLEARAVGAEGGRVEELARVAAIGVIAPSRRARARGSSTSGCSTRRARYCMPRVALKRSVPARCRHREVLALERPSRTRERRCRAACARCRWRGSQRRVAPIDQARRARAARRRCASARAPRRAARARAPARGRRGRGDRRARTACAPPATAGPRLRPRAARCANKRSHSSQSPAIAGEVGDQTRVPALRRSRSRTSTSSSGRDTATRARGAARRARGRAVAHTASASGGAVDLLAEHPIGKLGREDRAVPRPPRCARARTRRGVRRGRRRRAWRATGRAARGCSRGARHGARRRAGSRSDARPAPAAACGLLGVDPARLRPASARDSSKRSAHSASIERMSGTRHGAAAGPMRRASALVRRRRAAAYEAKSAELEVVDARDARARGAGAACRRAPRRAAPARGRSARARSGRPRRRARRDAECRTREELAPVGDAARHRDRVEREVDVARPRFDRRRRLPRRRQARHDTRPERAVGAGQARRAPPRARRPGPDRRRPS